MRKALLLLPVMLGTALFSQWSPNASTTITPNIQSAAESGNNVIQGREILVQSTMNAKPAAGALLVYFDPAAQSFLWLFYPALARSDSAPTASKPWISDSLSAQNHGLVFAAHDGIFLFRSGPRVIRVTKPAGSATSLDDAQTQSLKLLPTQMPLQRDMSYIELAPLMSKYRVLGPSSNMGYPKIQSVARQGSNWEIVIEIMKKVIRIEVGPDLKILNANVVSVLPNK